MSVWAWYLNREDIWIVLVSFKERWPCSSQIWSLHGLWQLVWSPKLNWLITQNLLWNTDSPRQTPLSETILNNFSDKYRKILWHIPLLIQDNQLLLPVRTGARKRLVAGKWSIYRNGPYLGRKAFCYLVSPAVSSDLFFNKHWGSVLYSGGRLSRSSLIMWYIIRNSWGYIRVFLFTGFLQASNYILAWMNFKKNNFYCIPIKILCSESLRRAVLGLGTGPRNPSNF